MYKADETAWVGREIWEALTRALFVRRHGQEVCGADSALRATCQALGARAVARARGPEHVVTVFRAAWDWNVQRDHGDDPRSLLYYGSLSQCLDAYSACAAGAAALASGAESRSGVRAAQVEKSRA